MMVRLSGYKGDHQPPTTSGDIFLLRPLPKTVLLDAGFTLTFPDHDRIASHAAEVGVRVDPAALARAEDPVRRELALYPWASTPAQQTTRPPSAGAAFFRRMLDLAGADAPGPTLDAAASTIWQRHLQRNVWCRVGAGVEAALGRLRAAGMRLAVVSNSEGTVEAMLNEVGLARHLETVVDSWVVGVAKPDPRIFHIALERLGESPATAVMLGDVPAVDMEGALAASITGVLIDPLDLHLAHTRRVPSLPAFVDALLG
ncbi:MAG TPA: HAD family hydrolase [Polyangia bacterium]